MLQGMLAKRGIHAPSDIQAAAIPKVFMGTSVAIQSYTGSGKVLSINFPALMLQTNVHSYATSAVALEAID